MTRPIRHGAIAAGLLVLAGCVGAPVGTAYYPPGAPYPYAPAPAPETNLVAAVQGELSRLTYLNGAVDGVAGPRTAEAIRRFQRTHGMPVDGQPSGELLDMLRRTPAGY